MSVLEKIQTLVTAKENRKSKEEREREATQAADLKNKAEAWESITKILKEIDGKTINKLKIKVVFYDNIENNETVAYVYNDNIQLLRVEYKKWLMAVPVWERSRSGDDLWQRGFQMTYHSYPRKESMTDILPVGYQDLPTVCEKFEDWVAEFLAQS